MFIRKNIWLIFYMMLFVGLILTGVLLYFKFQSIKQDFQKNQEHYVSIIQNSFHSILLQHETTLDFIGNQLLFDYHANKPNQRQKVLDQALKKDPDLAGYGLIDIEGNFIAASSNINIKKMPNLKYAPQTAKSFQEALTHKEMVLGRTYFAKGLGHWVVPLRKSIYNDHGDVKGVMTTGIKIDNELHFIKANQLLDNQAIILIRDKTLYRQFYISKNPIDKKYFYSSPIPKSFEYLFERKLQKTYHLTINDIKKSQQTVTVTTPNVKGNIRLASFKYDKRYKLWYVISTPKSYIYTLFLPILYLYLVIFIAIFILFFLLFKEIDKNEQITRKKLLFQAEHDPLTQLPNRAYLNKAFKVWQSRFIDGFTLIFADLDNFKHINDRFGHQIGDELLLSVTKRLKNYFKKDALIIRQGGDEFIILIPHITHESEKDYLDDLIKHITHPYTIQELELSIGISLGLANYPEHSNTLYELMSYADIALYEAKKVKNRAVIFSESMRVTMERRSLVDSELRHAIERQEFYMVYQPQINQEGSLYGVEALIRWHNEKLGMVSPEEFISVAEANGMMPEIGHYIQTTAFKDISDLQKKLNTVFQLSINVSVREFLQSGFIHTLKQSLSQTSLEARNITLEITETLFIEDLNYVLPLMQELKSLGFKLSLDDFGTGYSSLSMLKSLPLDELKIDKSFVDEIIKDIQEASLVKSIITISKNLSLHALAEGTESVEQVELLKNFGCKRFQGYHFSKPLDITSLELYIQALTT